MSLTVAPSPSFLPTDIPDQLHHGPCGGLSLTEQSNQVLGQVSTQTVTYILRPEVDARASPPLPGPPPLTDRQPAGGWVVHTCVLTLCQGESEE